MLFNDVITQRYSCRSFSPQSIAQEIIDRILAAGRIAPTAVNNRPMQEIAVEYNDTVIYPDKVRLNCYYYRHYSFVKDIQMIFCTVLGKKMGYAGEVI